MKKVVMTIIAVFGLAIFLNSCGDDPVTPKPTPTPTTNKYFPVTDGSWWKYTFVNYDSTGAIDESLTENFKYLCTGKEQKDGKDANVFQVQDFDGNKIRDNEYYYTTGYQIWNHSGLLPDLPFTLPTNIPVQWYKIADEKGNEWELYKEKLENDTLKVLTFTVILDDEVIIKFKYIGEEDVYYGANKDIKVKAKKYTRYLIYGGDAYILLGTFKNYVSLPLSVETNYYYAENIGLVKVEVKPWKVSVPLYPKPIWEEFGNEQILLEYEVK